MGRSRCAGFPTLASSQQTPIALLSSDRTKQRLLDLIGKMCGPEQFLSEDDTEESLNRRMLMLGEEDELPPADVPRGPYMSPALPAVTPPRQAKPVHHSKSSNMQHLLNAYSETAAKPAPATGAAGSSSSSCDDASCSTGCVDGGSRGSSKRAGHEQRLEQIMTQVAQLEEQGRLVEASALLASQLGAPPPTELEEPAETAAPPPLPPPPTDGARAWPEPPDKPTTAPPPAAAPPELSELEL